MTYSSRPLLSLAAVSLTSLAACGDGLQACTLIGCDDGYRLVLAPTVGDWKPGSYDIEITADGVTSHCTTTVPPTSPSDASCTSPDASIQYIAASAPQPARIELLLSNAPKQVEIVLHRDGAEIFSRSATPLYKTTTPNGPDCPPVCKQAEESSMLP